MTVHVQSVIPLWIKTFNEALYNKLTAQEAWCYDTEFLLPPDTTPPDPLPEGWVAPTDPVMRPGITFFKPYFTQLSASFGIWKGPDVEKEVLALVIQMGSLYTSASLFSELEQVNPILDECDAYKLFNVNDLMDVAVTLPDNYFDDIDTSGISAKMEAAINQVATPIDVSASIPDLIDKLRLAAKGLAAKGTFQPPEGVAPDYIARSKRIFVDLHYQQAYETLNMHTTMTHTVPPLESKTMTHTVPPLESSGSTGGPNETG